MRARKVREIEQALLKKGFTISNTHHKFYILYVDGKKTSIRTKISHGKTEYDKSLLRLMALQLKLSQELFDALIDCPLSYEDYVGILRDHGYVS